MCSYVGRKFVIKILVLSCLGTRVYPVRSGAVRYKVLVMARKRISGEKTTSPSTLLKLIVE